MSAVLATAPPELASAASATNYASSQLGSSLGIAVSPSAMAWPTRRVWMR